MLNPATLAKIDTWIFDLDNTLYPPEAGLYPQLSARVLTWMRDHLKLREADILALQERYLNQHGATLSGLVLEYDVNAEDFLSYVHNIDYSGVQPNPLLANAIKALPGHCIIHTNGSARHARNVLKRLDVDETLFDGIFDLADAHYIAKPEKPAFDALVAKFALDPSTCCFIEDSLRNLEVPHAMGMATVLVTQDLPETVPDFCDVVTTDLLGWLLETGKALQSL